MVGDGIRCGRVSLECQPQRITSKKEHARNDEGEMISHVQRLFVAARSSSHSVICTRDIGVGVNVKGPAWGMIGGSTLGDGVKKRKQAASPGR